MQITLPRLRGRLDRIGVMLSAMCVVHCILGLVLLGAFGAAALGGGAGLLLHPAVHEVGLLLAVLIAGLTIATGAFAARPGARRSPALKLALAGLAAMTAALLVGHGPEEVVLTVIGVLLVGVAHWVNLRRA